MRFALLNPNWGFEGSIYFGCREPHLPLEFGYAKALLEQGGHTALLLDGQMDQLDLGTFREILKDFRPDFTVVTTAPSYLFWRCAPPELRVPMELCDAIRDLAGRLIVVGPHASTTPRSTLSKLAAEAVVLGECEDLLPLFAGGGWKGTPAGPPHATDMAALPALRWPRDYISKHRHHHHRFEAPPIGPGAEMETSRGCPYHCTFCAKDNFRDDYRRRPLPIIFDELDALLAQGVEYVYFIDEIFLPNRELLVGLAERKVKIGIQTRLDLWKPELIELLARAGCVSIEAGVESITPEGRAALDKNCRMSTKDLTERLILAKSMIPFVQANLLEMAEDDPDLVESWRAELNRHGVWANKPVPLFPYPGSPEYRRRWGAEDDAAWERAHAAYLNEFRRFSDIQEEHPLELVQLETR